MLKAQQTANNEGAAFHPCEMYGVVCIQTWKTIVQDPQNIYETFQTSDQDSSDYTSRGNLTDSSNGSNM